MAARRQLGDPGNGGTRRDRLEQVAGSYDYYAESLRETIAWFNRQTLSMSSVEHLLHAVEQTATELEREAKCCRARTGLRDATEIHPQSLAVDAIGVTGDHRNTTRAAVSVLGESDGGPRRSQV